jgi:hypothetical protein
VKVLENRVMWRIFGPKKDEVTGGWRIFHNQELHHLYFSVNIIHPSNGPTAHIGPWPPL